jgi:hypothetical protein
MAIVKKDNSVIEPKKGNNTGAGEKSGNDLDSGTLRKGGYEKSSGLGSSEDMESEVSE